MIINLNNNNFFKKFPSKYILNSNNLNNVSFFFSFFGKVLTFFIKLIYVSYKINIARDFGVNGLVNKFYKFENNSKESKGKLFYITEGQVNHR